MARQRSSLLVLCSIFFVSVTVAVPLASEYLMDSPQHVIKPANYRNSVGGGAAAAAEEALPATRTGKAEESDGELMYVVIKPAPVPKKYSPDNRAIHMEGAGVGRTPRLNLAGGAYPVFYSIASANGKFGRNIRALTKEEISRAELGLGLGLEVVP